MKSYVKYVNEETYLQVIQRIQVIQKNKRATRSSEIYYRVGECFEIYTKGKIKIYY